MLHSVHQGVVQMKARYRNSLEIVDSPSALYHESQYLYNLISSYICGCMISQLFTSTDIMRELFQHSSQAKKGPSDSNLTRGLGRHSKGFEHLLEAGALGSKKHAGVLLPATCNYISWLVASLTLVILCYSHLYMVKHIYVIFTSQSLVNRVKSATSPTMGHHLVAWGILVPWGCPGDPGRSQSHGSFELWERWNLRKSPWHNVGSPSPQLTWWRSEVNGAGLKLLSQTPAAF